MLVVATALLCAANTMSALLFCGVWFVVAACVFALGAVIGTRLDEKLRFFVLLAASVLVSLPLAMACGVLVGETGAIVFISVGAGGSVAFLFENNNDVGDVVCDAIAKTVGIAIVVVPFAVLREILSSGAFFGIKLFEGIEFFGKWYGAALLFVFVAACYRHITRKVEGEK